MPQATKPASNSRGIKVHNRLLVRDTIRMLGPIPRREVARIVGLTPPAVTVIVNELMRENIVKEVGWGESSGGRKPVMLALNPQAGFVFAARLQRGESVAALLDLSGNILEKRLKKLDTSLPEDVVEALGESFDSLLRSTGIAAHDVLWCGVASPGLVDSSQGVVQRSSNLNWNKVPLADMLSARLAGAPVHVENISNAAALAEKEYGSGRGCPNLLYLNLSVGIGAGIIIGDLIYGGARGYAGEVGHIVLTPDGGPECICGTRGCFEAVCGARTVLEKVKAEVPEETLARFGMTKAKLSIEDVVTPPIIDLPAVRSILMETGRLIGIVTANLVSIFNPEMVILGGDLARAGDIVLDKVRQVVKDQILSQIEEAVQVVRSNMAEDPPLMGAYALALRRVFALDEWRKRA